MERQISLGILEAQPKTPHDIYWATRHPNFIAGTVLVDGNKVDPDCDRALMHMALIVPGILSVMKNEPQSIEEILSCVSYILDYSHPQKFPNVVSPSIPFQDAKRDPENRTPIIGLYFTLPK